MSTALIAQNQAIRSIDFLPEAVAERESVLEACALISVVRTVEDNEVAQAAMTLMIDFHKKMEAGRVVAKEPALLECRHIDKMVADFVAPSKEEELRVRKLQGDFLTLQDAKRRDAEAAQRRDLEELERRKHAEMAQAQTHEQREKTAEKFDNLQQAVPPPPPIQKAKGQAARPTLEIEIVDLHALYAAQPACVKLEVRMRELTELINSLPEGTEVPGVKYLRVISSGVAGKRRQGVLEIGGGQ